MTEAHPTRPWLTALCALLACCGSGGNGDAPAGRPPLTDEQAAQDAQGLSKELFELVDRAASYRSSHRGRNARSLRDLGVDSLTPKTARWLVLTGGEPQVTVAYRHPDAGGIRSCSGGLSVLEELSLEGKITLRCRTTDGATRAVAADPTRAR